MCAPFHTLSAREPGIMGLERRGLWAPGTDVAENSNDGRLLSVANHSDQTSR